jgi:predicted Zn finger-like uncharacterized protein
MIVICEECGKKYDIDPSKIRGERARFKCKACNHVITVTKPAAEPLEPAAIPEDSPPPSPPPREHVVKKEEGPRASELKKERKPAKAKTPKVAGLKSRRIGLRGKMLILFLLVPIVFIAAAGALYWWQLNSLSSLLTNEVKQMAESVIANTARAVAIECKLFLDTHPDMQKKDLNYNMDFRKFAVQKVGMTGYTCIYSLPDENGVSSLWAHPNPKVIGIDLPKAMRKALGKEYVHWWKIYEGAYKGKESKGYYLWQDADGSIRDKYMVCTPVEGTPYVIAATTYADEFTRPMQVLETRAKKQTLRTRNITFGILGGTLILIGVIVSLYGNTLTTRIKSLTETADRISLGELDAEIEAKSNDELGDLGEAISRMQESIRLSIERLRRRR